MTPHLFKRASALGLIAVAALATVVHAQPAGPRLELWRSYAGVTWAAPQPHNDVDADSASAPIAGVHMDSRSRVFVSTPRLLSAKAPSTLSLLDTRYPDGPARLRAFPSVDGNAVAAAPAAHLRNVLGFHVDHRNGWLWALDMGFVAGEQEAPAGGQKLVVYDLRSGRVVKRIALDAVADRAGSFLNDVAVDEVRKIAYISDSGLRSAPRNQAGIIVAEFASGRVRRVLHQHRSVMPADGVSVVSHGEEVWPGNPLRLGINGIALSPDRQALYWAVTTGTTVFRIPTQALLSPALSDDARAAAVVAVGDIGGNSDGIVFGRDGHLYITDVTRNGIVQLNVRTGEAALVASSDDIFWPDTATLAPGGDIVFSASRLNGHFAGTVKAGSERYQLWRLRSPGPKR
jgi:sugar lactone lactonase YvrE